MAPSTRETGAIQDGISSRHFYFGQQAAEIANSQRCAIGLVLLGGFKMHDVYFWIAFFGAPLFLLLVTAIVFRPSAREQYRAAKRIIFADDDPAKR